MYISTFSTYVGSVQPYNKQQPAAPSKSESSFKELLAQKQLAAYTLNKSFPVDYVNKESTLFNQIRMQTPKDTDTSKSLEESTNVSSFDLLKTRTDIYMANTDKMKSFNKYTQPLTPNLGDIKFQIQKQKIANIYLSNDAYFNKIAI
ncbi:MAG: hypothetical protein PHX13_04450 [Thiovulaceae bacterium]|nr:hypothetical protein [Sulfurimonadaceae bacterium]